MNISPDGCRYRGYIATKAGIVRFLAIAILVVISASSSQSGSESEDSHQSESKDQDESNDDDQQWYADDPYYPSDDRYIQQMEWEREENAKANEMNKIESENISANMHKMTMQFLAGSSSLLGLGSAIFCSAVFLYFLRVDSLMRRYARDDTVTAEGRILASIPDVQEEITKLGVENFQKYDNDSYSIMTDDESFQTNRLGSGSGSGSDGSRDNLIEEGQSNGNLNHVYSAAKSKQSLPNESRFEKPEVSAAKEKFYNMTFSVIVEYDDVTYHDIISQESSSRIRKRLKVTGKDIYTIDPSDASTDPCVKLRVFRDQPLSGHPEGEVRRSLKWSKRLTFNVYILAGLALVVLGAYEVAKFFPPALLYVYNGCLILQLPLLNCFLDGSFRKIISERYIENGVKQPTAKSKKMQDSKEKMVAALKKGTSFNFV